MLMDTRPKLQEFVLIIIIHRLKSGNIIQIQLNDVLYVPTLPKSLI